MSLPGGDRNFATITNGLIQKLWAYPAIYGHTQQYGLTQYMGLPSYMGLSVIN